MCKRWPPGPCPHPNTPIKRCRNSTKVVPVQHSGGFTLPTPWSSATLFAWPQLDANPGDSQTALSHAISMTMAGTHPGDTPRQYSSTRHPTREGLAHCPLGSSLDWLPLNKVVTVGTYLSMSYYKPTANIILKGEKLKVFQDKEKKDPTLITFIQHSTQHRHSNQTTKINK